MSGSNREIPALVLSAVASSTNGADQENYSCRSAVVVINITALSGGGTCTITLQGKDELSGQYYTILASAALNGTGTTVLRVDPSLTASANTIAADIVPRKWRVISTHSSATVTATVGVSLVG